MRIRIYIDSQFKEFNLESYGKDTITFGRSSQCDITIRKEYISRQHGYFYRKDGYWYVHDLHSTNGIRLEDSKVNDVKISGKIFRIYNKEDRNNRVKIVAEKQLVPSYNDSNLEDLIKVDGASGISPDVSNIRQNSNSAGMKDYSNAEEMKGYSNAGGMNGYSNAGGMNDYSNSGSMNGYSNSGSMNSYSNGYNNYDSYGGGNSVETGASGISAATNGMASKPLIITLITVACILVIGSVALLIGIFGGDDDKTSKTSVSKDKDAGKKDEDKTEKADKKDKTDKDDKKESTEKSSDKDKTTEKTTEKSTKKTTENTTEKTTEKVEETTEKIEETTEANDRGSVRPVMEPVGYSAVNSREEDENLFDSFLCDLYHSIEGQTGHMLGEYESNEDYDEGVNIIVVNELDLDVKYTFIDIDNDYADELVIGTEDCIYGIVEKTSDNYRIVASGHARKFLKHIGDGIYYVSGSGGAAYHGQMLKTYHGSESRMVTYARMEDDSSEGAEHAHVYYGENDSDIRYDEEAEKEWNIKYDDAANSENKWIASYYVLRDYPADKGGMVPDDTEDDDYFYTDE